MSFNFGQFFLNLLLGAASGSVAALSSGHASAAGPAAIIGAAGMGVGFLQDPHKVNGTDVLKALQPFAAQEATSLIDHNTKTLGAAAPLVQQVVDNALTPPGTNAAPPAPAIPINVPPATPPTRVAVALPPIKPIPLPVPPGLTASEWAQIQQQRQQQAVQVAPVPDQTGDPNAPPAGPQIPQL